MPIELTKDETARILPSIRQYFREELDQDLSEMQARFLLEYFLREIAPFAYNKGVRDAERQLRATVEDLSSTCFEEGMTYWQRKKK